MVTLLLSDFQKKRWKSYYRVTQIIRGPTLRIGERPTSDEPDK